MARHLPAPSVMLRLKGEPDDSMADGAVDEAASGEFDESFRNHPAFDSGSLPDGDDFEDDGPREGRWSILSDTRGLAIAAAAFVPTFLLVFFGVPYLLEGPSLARTPDSSTVAYARDPQSDSEWSLAKSLSEALRGGPFDRPQWAPPSAPSPAPAAPPAVATTPPAPAAPPATPAPPAAPPVTSAPPVAAAPAAPALSATTETPPAKSPIPSAPTRGSETPAALGDEARSREQTGEPMPGTSASRQSSDSAFKGSDSSSTAPSLPPAAARVPDPERKAPTSKPVLEPRSVPAPRHAAATPDPARAQSEARRGASDWTPAAAFADRDAAARLASSIERQGYPVEIRQEASSTRPWVVWIGSQPSGGGRRR
jgi:hypothetical protein